MDEEKVKITVLKKEYEVFADPLYADAIQRYINEKIEEIEKKTVNTCDILALTLIKVADEYFQIQNTLGNINHKIDEIILEIDTALGQ